MIFKWITSLFKPFIVSQQGRHVLISLYFINIMSCSIGNKFYIQLINWNQANLFIMEQIMTRFNY